MQSLSSRPRLDGLLSDQLMEKDSPNPELSVQLGQLRRVCQQKMTAAVLQSRSGVALKNPVEDSPLIDRVSDEASNYPFMWKRKWLKVKIYTTHRQRADGYRELAKG